PVVRDEVSRSQQYDTDAPRPVTLRDIGVRAGTLFSLALAFALVSWIAAPPPSADDPAAGADDPGELSHEGVALVADPPPDQAEPKRPDEPPTPADTRDEPAPVPENTQPDPAPVPADTKAGEPDIRLDDAPPAAKAEPVPEDTKSEPAPEDTKSEPPPSSAVAEGPAPDPDFNYRSAEKELRSQHKFFQNCLDNAGQSGGKLKFSIEVRKSGMPPHKIKVFSSNDAVRTCVRGLFEQFPFDPSPRGGAFSYTYSSNRATFERLPLSSATTSNQ
ncbi:MAG TPA: hypothetical protein VIK91_28200, partial [Nannocystis sp.]